MKKIIFIFLSILSVINYANAKDFFLNITDQIVENEFRLSYGVSVTDVNKDNKYDFVVTGFGFKNLALSYKDGKLINIVNEKIFQMKREEQLVLPHVISIKMAMRKYIF